MTKTNPKPKRRWLRFRLRTLLIVVVLLIVPLGWFALKMRQAERQREVVEAIEKTFFQCHYFDRKGPPASPLVRFRMWLAKSIGSDLVLDVVHVEPLAHRDFAHILEQYDLESFEAFGDSELETLGGLTALERVELPDSQVTDLGLVHLQGLTRLRYLDLTNTQVTKEGVQELQKALPNCEIDWSPRSEPGK